MKRILTVAVALLVLVFFGAWLLARQIPNADNVSDGNKPLVAVSIYPVEYLVKTIGGELIRVEPVVPVGVEPHDFEPSTSQMRLLETAENVFVIGGDLEPWSKGVSPERIVYLGEKFMKENDPHVWLDPLTMANMAAAVAEKLSANQPQNKKIFDANLSKLQNVLNDLDSKMRSGLKSCSNRTMVVSHDAFGYLADRYALTQIEISGLTHEDEPSPRELAEITSQVKAQNIKTIFLESLENPGLAEALATETGAKVLPLSPVEMLSEDEVNSGEDYVSIMEENLNNLRSGLGCK